MLYGWFIVFITFSKKKKSSTATQCEWRLPSNFNFKYQNKRRIEVYELFPLSNLIKFINLGISNRKEKI